MPGMRHLRRRHQHVAVTDPRRLLAHANLCKSDAAKMARHQNAPVFTLKKMTVTVGVVANVNTHDSIIRGQTGKVFEDEGRVHTSSIIPTLLENRA